MRNDSSSDVAASESDDEPSVTAVADEPAVTRERAPEIEAGDVLAGRYQIEAILGKGGSGVVLRAFDRVSATVVAVKVLKAGLTHDPRWAKRFSRELRIGRPIRHANVCRIFDIGDAEGYRFLTMEFATGGTLRDLIKKNQPPRPLSERLADAAGVIAGLAAIHDAGIVHRDVKPDNVLRMADGRLVLSDFGLATDLPDSTMVSVFVGTPHYMAPEVREGDPATTRSDVWSLGVVLHEIFFGKRPERRNSRSVASLSKGSGPPTASRIERAMLALCERCLADDPAERPENAQAVQRLLEQGQRSPAAILRRSRRRPTVRVAFLGLAAIVATMVGVRLYPRAPAPASPVQAGIRRVEPTGEPADWTKVAHVVATVPAHVHCFTRVDDKAIRVIWGSPRKAEDVNIDTGVRRPSSLVPEAYSTGCPDLSPDGHQLLFTASTSAGATEIRHSANANGRDAKTVTPGSDPAWLTNGEEFVYSIDGSNTAVFSLPTMHFRLLGDPGLGGQQTILGKGASPHSEVLALLLFGKDVQWALAVYEGAGLSLKATSAIPAARTIRLGSDKDKLFVSSQAPLAPLRSFDWRTGVYRNIGQYAGLDLIDVLETGEQAALLGRRRTRDVWLVGSAGRQRLTNDGEIVAAAISRTGELLLVRPGPGGSFKIWLRSPDGALKKLTSGQFDTTPDFSPDGRSWVYVDYSQKSIMICETSTNACKVLRRDEMLPSWPRFSPDGKQVAYVRQSTVPRLIAVSVSDGKEWTMGDTHWQCPPVWESPKRIWGFEGSAGRYAWVERELETRLRTGRRVEVKEHQSAINDDLECWPENVDVTSPFFRKLRVETEETSSILRLPRSRLD